MVLVKVGNELEKKKKMAGNGMRAWSVAKTFVMDSKYCTCSTGLGGGAPSCMMRDTSKVLHC